MGLLGPSFQIGRSALAAYQAAIAVVGQNIANLGNANYTRQTGRLTAELGGPVLGGVSPGAGVRMSQLERHIDEALEARLRDSLATRSGSELTHRALGQVESLYNELSDQDISTRLTQLFGSFSSLQATPTNASDRNVVIASADNLIRTIRRQRTGLLQQVSDLNKSATSAASRVSEIADEIAKLNRQIVGEEARTQGPSGPLRDRRDALLREMSEITQIQTRQQDNGAVNVYIASEPLVEMDRARALTTEIVVEDGLEKAKVRFADDHSGVALRDGQLAAIVETRDVHINEQLGRLDQLAKGLIYEVNRVHANGRGLVGYGSITSNYAVQDPNAVLTTAQANLPFPLQNGTFVVNVRDTNTGQTITRQIEVDLDGLGGNDTTLASLAGALGAVPGLSASVTADNRLQISAGSGSEFWFSDDNSGALAALGVGAFFQGTDAGTIDIQSAVRNDPRLIAASLTGELADGDNAGRLALVGNAVSGLLGGTSIEDYHASTIDRLAVTAGAAETQTEAADAIYSSLLAQRESISGVSLDEEAINLTKFERAFQGATRYIGVLDNLTNEILTLVR